MAVALKPQLDEEPIRLLQKKEYRAAVISAITLLESELRGRLETLEPSAVKLRFTLSMLMQLAIKFKLLPQDYQSRIAGWVSIRSRVVHGAADVSAVECRDVVEGIQGILSTLRTKNSNS